MSPLGVIRIGVLAPLATGPVFEIPYFEDGMFERIINNARANGFIGTDTVFIPFHAVAFLAKVPHEVLIAEKEARAETRQ